VVEKVGDLLKLEISLAEVEMKKATMESNLMMRCGFYILELKEKIPVPVRNGIIESLGGEGESMKDLLRSF